MQVGDLSLERPDVVEGLLGAWDSHLAQRAGAATELELSPEFVDLLQRTGYDFQPLE